ncbi:MAG: helix-turn-helix domain containing protein [Mycobacterium sp.]|nr:helix-turn-helix domain containing protein [Mycobacterium sp.]
MSRPGRPRHRDALRPGATAVEQILDAAGELFVTQGYTVTSTRSIADAVGIRQASLYHHFPNKEAILEALLDATVVPSLDFARRVTRSVDDPRPALWALSAGDAANLLSVPWNLGRLYLLPEVDSIDGFHQRRSELHSVYRELAVQIMGGHDEFRCGLPVRITETAIAQRVDQPALSGDEVAAAIADAALQVLGVDVDDALRSQGQTLVERYLPVP